ncbi:MAG: hypothetical protein IKH16_11400, partial [Selenomonadaceae bacterium]|nr:hypothetical protein [Selenomonadaceae bacterium]
MTIVDATAAIQNTDGETMKALDAGAKTSFDVAYTDTIDGKNLTLEGTRTDTLSQEDDAATSTKNSKLIYTVGNKNVDRAAFDGTVDFSNGAVHYKADGDYQFGSETKIDAAKLAFKETTAAIGAGDNMTLLSAARLSSDNGVTQPTNGGITVAYKDQGVDFNAAATGQVKAETGAVK